MSEANQSIAAAKPIRRKATVAAPVARAATTALAKKVKLALDETRTLILGGSVLLGFQMRAAFNEGFDALPAAARGIDAAALLLMVLVVALLIAPGPRHRIVEAGHDSAQLHRFVTMTAGLSMLPFGLALGLDVYVMTSHALGETSGLALGAAAGATALGFWYLLPATQKWQLAGQESDMTGKHAEKRTKTPLHARIEQMLTEARVIAPGVQALFGFQLTMILTQSFDRLPYDAKLPHTASLCLVALSVVLLMTPPAYPSHPLGGGGHRRDVPDRQLAHHRRATEQRAWLRQVGLAGDVCVVIAKALSSPLAGLVCGSAALALLIGLWHAYPTLVALLHRQVAP